MRVEKIDNDGRRWYRVTGRDYGTGLDIDGEYAVTEDAILNADGIPLTEGDHEWIAVNRAIENA